MTAATETTTVTCSRCSRTTEHPERDHWLMRAVPVVVQGKTLGLCVACLGGSTPDDTAPEKRCEGKCGGDYRPESGTYFEATWGRYPAKEKWACWDEQCAEDWLNGRDDCCIECGSDVDTDLAAYVNGKRVRR